MIPQQGADYLKKIEMIANEMNDRFKDIQERLTRLEQKQPAVNVYPQYPIQQPPTPQPWPCYPTYPVITNNANAVNPIPPGSTAFVNN